MEDYTFCFINESEEIIEEAVKISLETMPDANMWPDLDEKKAIDTVKECIKDENICIEMKIKDKLIG